MAANTIRIGDVEIMSLLDAAATPPRHALFPNQTPEDWEPHKEYIGPDGKSIDLAISSFLVRSGGKTILVDTGIGAKDRPYFPNGRLPEAIVDAGVALAEIDVVMATHIHLDHVGWHTTALGDGFVPTFPMATHVFNRAEFEYWTAPDVARAEAHVKDCVLPLIDVAEISLVDGEHKLTDEVTLLPTPGHSPSHVSVAILSAGEAGVIIGDVCHHPAQVTDLWTTVFDMNPALARESREKLLQRIEDERMTVIAGHFAHPGFGRIVRIEGKRYWRAGL